MIEEFMLITLAKKELQKMLSETRTDDTNTQLSHLFRAKNLLETFEMAYRSKYGITFL